MTGMISKARQTVILWGILLVCGTATVQAAEPICVWEVVTTYRTYLDDGRMTLMSDGKSDKGLSWTIIRDSVDFGREGKAVRRADGTFFKGNWIGGWHLNARVIMNNAIIKSEYVAPETMPKDAGESLIGTKPAPGLQDSIVDLWEFVAILPGTNRFIRLTCDFTPNKLVLDGDRKIGTYEFQKSAVVVNFIDPQFGRIVFAEKPDNVLSGKGKAVNRKRWELQFTRVQRQAVYKTADNKDFILYTNHRVNSPRYTPDYYTTFNWYFYTEGGTRRLACQSGDATLSAGGRELTWSGQKMILIAGVPPR
ncbi:hypothetical protein [Gimesia maris]|uniref:Uncharacterized protein n=1 Tax=Gimesia maris TaxID=122 RepID=A0ABX5YL44_9PLAN|nr:hypothetical protein [Gimesia maris]EDL57034.1 hypothetical protein PM8797T_00774 [Gimesia maris DSM 8797]QEG16386.1 hypothetical protein GmarT_22490 [Gimesia maris]QGQ30419.1 hypothetical protein F1729_18160 [Gimesia maris]